MFMSNQREQILIEFYKAQWKVISDLDELDWRVALVFVPLVGALSFVFGIAWEFVSQGIRTYTNAIQAASFVSYLISLYGTWTVTKGQVLTMLKFKKLGDIEKELGVRSYVCTRPERYKFQRIWPVIACRRLVLFIVYFILGFFSLTMTVIPINEWTLLSVFGKYVSIIIVQIIIVSLMLVVHYCDYHLHLKNEQISHHSTTQRHEGFEILVKEVPPTIYRIILESVPIACVDLVIHTEDKYLLFLRKDQPAQGKWWLPGGRIWRGENIEDAVLRKAKEETGMDVKIEKFIKAYGTTFPEGPFGVKDVHMITLCYLVTPVTGRLEDVKLDEHHRDFKIFDKADKNLDPYVVKVIEDSGL